jgi:hypothetical protein
MRGAEKSGALVNLRPYLSLGAMYTQGLTPASVDQAGSLADRDSFGYQATFGVAGQRAWRRSALGLNYNGSLSHYNRSQSQDGLRQSLTLGYTRQLLPRVTLALTEAAGTSSRGTGFEGMNGFGGMGGGLGNSSVSGLGPTDPTLSMLPSDELLDTRMYYGASGADVTYHKSQRLSFNMGGTGFTVRRRAAGTAGVLGAGARGDISYALSPKQVIGVSYLYSRYQFTRGIGTSEVHGAGLNYSFEPAPRWRASVMGGAFRVESLRTVSVALDPVVQAILGEATGLELFYGVNYGIMGQASLTRSFRRSSVQMNYSRQVVPGNGIYLTSRRDMAGGGYSWSTLRRWSFNLGANYSRYTAYTQRLPALKSYGGEAGLSCRILRSLHISGAYGVRQYEAGTGFKRLSSTASIQLAFAPGEYALSFW